MATETVPGTTAVETPEPAKPRELTSLSEAQYAEWRKTGEIPAEESATLTEKPKPAAAEKRTAAEPKNGVEPPPVTKLGYGDLRKKVREQEAELSRLRARTTETEPPEPAARPTSTTEPEKEAAAKVRPKPQPTDKDKDGKPKYATYEDYVEDLTDWKTEERFKFHTEEQTKRAQQEAVEREQRKISETWRTQVESARKNHADFDTVALDKDLPIPHGSAVEQWVLDSDIGTELLYYMGSHRDELEAVNAMHPVKAARYLTALEAELSGEDEPPAPPKPETRTTKAPPPTREVGGRGTAAVDELTKAVADDDTRAYINAANRRDIAKKKR